MNVNGCVCVYEVVKTDSDRRSRPADARECGEAGVIAPTPKRSSLVTILILVLVILALICVGLVVALAVREVQRGQQKPKQVQEKCVSPACVEAAARLQLSIDNTVKPCDNFYQFVCGNWVKRHVIPDDLSSVSNFGLLRDEVTVAMKGLLEQKESPSDLEPTKKAKLLYRSCMNLDRMSVSTGIKNIKTMADKLGGLPYVTPGYNADARKLEDIYSKPPIYGVVNTGFSFSITFDAVNSSVQRIRFDQSSAFILSSLQFYKNHTKYQSQINAYKVLLKDFLTFIKEDFNATTLTDNNISVITENILAMETSLAKASTPPGLRRNISDQYNLTTLNNMHSMFPEFNWTYFVNAIFKNAGVNIAVTKEEIVDLGNYKFFAQAQDTLFKGDKNLLSTYHLLSSLKGLIRHLPKKYREKYSEFSEAVYGNAVQTSRYKECFRTVNSMLNHATGRMFIDSLFPEEAKKDTLAMIDRVRVAFNQLLLDNTWMDVETREAAKQKAKLIREHIAYPDWTRNNTKLTEFYKDATVTKTNFVEDYLNLSKRSAKQLLLRYRKPVNRDEWITSAAIVNAYYMPPYNSITFPAAILQPPFFHKDYPRYLNYGAIGVVIGHEITHGFDDQGRQRDGEGNYRPWWKQEAVDKFRKQAKCLIYQYGNFTAPNNMKLNGIQTQGENIADNGGIKQAFASYQKWVNERGSPEKSLPGLDFNPEQLFFINFAYIWCHNDRLTNYRHMIFNGVHSPGMFRVMGSVQNSPDFAEAFQCKKGDKMNPVKKCNVW